MQRLLIFSVALLLVGCTALPGADREAVRTYVLDPRLPSPGVAVKRDFVIEVMLPHARAGYESPRMAYRQEPYRLDYFAYNAWADAPAAMLGPLLVSALRASEGFEAVTPKGVGASGDVLLHTEIRYLHHDFTSEQPLAKIALEVTLVDARRRSLIASRLFTAEEPAREAEPYAGVVAINRAMGRLLGEVVGFVSEEIEG